MRLRFSFFHIMNCSIKKFKITERTCRGRVITFTQRNPARDPFCQECRRDPSEARTAHGRLPSRCRMMFRISRRITLIIMSNTSMSTIPHRMWFMWVTLRPIWAAMFTVPALFTARVITTIHGGDQCITTPVHAPGVFMRAIIHGPAGVLV